MCETEGYKKISTDSALRNIWMEMCTMFVHFPSNDNLSEISHAMETDGRDRNQSSDKSGDKSLDNL